MNDDPITRLKQYVASLGDRGITASWTANSLGEKPSAFMDIQSPTAIGRITAWASNEWDFETISIDSELTTFSVYLNNPHGEELAVTLKAWESSLLI